MIIPLNWLKDYVDINLPVDELAKKLTLAGFEAEEVEDIGGGWDNVIVGQITAVNAHPNADRLRLATVDLGGEEETVVCGAPNLKTGDRIAFARVGARLINPYNGDVEELKTAKIRGVASSGMICSEKELGISDNHEGILVLAETAAVGIPLSDYMGDTILDLDVTANRPDCLSVVGIAREVAAITGEKLHIPEIEYLETETLIEDKINIEIIDPDLCPRYTATLITGVTIKDSPAWLQERLIACGQRPINNVVDITNYVMMEYGQPLHSFDYDTIANKKIFVRRADEGEDFTTLDGVDRKLTNNMLVIGDGERTVAIAGVMGGLNTEVTEATTNILLEAASFNAASNHYTSNYLGLSSEASMRFGRGISAGMTIPALRHATKLIAELGDGEITGGIMDIYPGEEKPITVSVTAAKTSRWLGIEVTVKQILDALNALGFTCTSKGDKVNATVPYWRSDIKQDVDLIEEVARIIGYDKIPTTLFKDPIPSHTPDKAVDIIREIRRDLTGMGFYEIMTYTLTSLEMMRRISGDQQPPEPMPPHIANPMSAEQEYLRGSLRPHLLGTLAANRKHEDGSIRLFELGKIFVAEERGLPAEPEVLGGIMNGARVENTWFGGDGAFDFYDVKGVIEGLFHRLGIAVSFERSNDHGLHPSRQAAIVVKDNGMTVKLGVIGELHPKVADAFEIAGTTCLFEVNINPLLAFATGEKPYSPVPRFPSTYRDLAVVVDAGVSHQSILDIIGNFSLVSEVKLFDVYAGKQVEAGKKSLAYRLVYQSPTHTLTDEEVNKVQAQILKRLTGELGATLRG
ncbi:MAG: phenylalanine--tRNA ligase subunit beta [Dehalococcoidia bacterium]|jgi:phenylalanyl-tRNA synthetase beta chain